MRQSLIALISFLIFLGHGKDSTAQTQQVKFNLIQGTNGIGLGKVNCIIEDKYGFTWFSDQTNRCIVRFDGSHMTRYQNDPKDPKSLGGYYPECLATDPSGVIWIGFYGMGLDRFDPASNTFTHYRHHQNDSSSLANDFVAAIQVDHLGNVWIGNYGGLDLLDQKSGKFKHFDHREGDPASLSHNKVREIYEDREGELWVGTGFPWDDDNNGGLNHFHRESGTFTQYMNDPQNPNSLINNKVRSIFEDSRGTFWVGTAGDGLHTMDRKTGLFTRLTYNPAKPDQLSRLPATVFGDHITFITEDKAGKIWIGTENKGLVRYDPVSNRIERYGNDADKTGAFRDNSGWWAHASGDGLIWLSTQEANLYKIDIYNNLIPHFGDSPNDNVNGFYEGPDSTLWFATRTGLISKNLKNGTSTRFVNDPNNTNSLSNSNAIAIIQDKYGDLWIGTARGLSQYHPRSKIFTRYLYGTKNDPLAAINFIISVFEDRDGNIWTGTAGTGLYMLNKKTGQIKNYRANPADTNSISTDYAGPMLEDESSNLWIGLGGNGGINRLNRQSGRFQKFLPGMMVSSIYRDADGILWAGTLSGLFRYNRKSDNFYLVNEGSTGISINSVVSIVGDNENNLWLGSLTGIYKLNPMRDHVNYYGRENGMNGEAYLNDNAAYKRRDGELYFGNYSGYYAFYPNKLSPEISTKKLYFTNFWVNDAEMKPGVRSQLKELIYYTKEIRLKYNQNVFSFGFTSIDFRHGSENPIFYKLENFDKDWHPATADNRVQYFKVPPGKYTLRIKTASVANGEWMEKSISIIISPPWWQTWWAYVIYGLLLVAFAISIHRFQKNRLIKAERERTRGKELAQAKEIEKAYHELRNTQAQLIQSEKMASLGELTAGIAHEIQNPLNFVNNFSEVNAELIDEAGLAIDAGKTDEARDLLASLRDNQIKINQHGQRADAIVKSMLQHSRSSAGQKEPTDINALADEYLRLSYHGLRAKDKEFNSALKTDFDGSIGNINIIPQDIGRVLLNLYNNAFYAVSKRKKDNGNGRIPLLPGAQVAVDGYQPIVTVSTRKENGHVFISVRDNGNGIPEKVKDKIFQPFFTTKPTGEGTGLGLSLSYDIIKTQGGKIKVETKEGEGTTFIIDIPAT